MVHSVLPLFGDVGCYVDDVDKNAFMFGGSEKLTLVSGDQAYTQAMVRISTTVLCGGGGWVGLVLVWCGILFMNS